MFREITNAGIATIPQVIKATGSTPAATEVRAPPRSPPGNATPCLSLAGRRADRAPRRYARAETNGDGSPEGNRHGNVPSVQAVYLPFPSGPEALAAEPANKRHRRETELTSGRLRA